MRSPRNDDNEPRRADHQDEGKLVVVEQQSRKNQNQERRIGEPGNPEIHRESSVAVEEVVNNGVRSPE